MNAFHYAFKVKDIESTRDFYVKVLGCNEGRSTETWIDFDFFGNQLSAHISADIPALDYCGHVDNVKVPIPHFGCILDIEEFRSIQLALERADVQFIIKSQLRYKDNAGEQYTMFCLDYSGNPIEFKAFSDPESIFRRT